MNKTDRMLAIVLELQRKGTLRAEDLAAGFETSVRTIYRDMQALSEAGVPIIGAPGTGYSLMEGYFLPPLRFTAEEAVALLVGTDFVGQQFDRIYGAKAADAARKIEGALPAEVRTEAERVRAAIRLLGARVVTANQGEEAENFAALRDAILERRKIRFHYAKGIAAANEERHSVREAAPYGLIFVRGSWMLLAYCELRQALRHFRVSRMSGLTVLADGFQLPDGFQLAHYAPVDDRGMTVKVRFDFEAAERVREAGSFYMESMEDIPEGLLVTLRVRRPEEVLHWILSWGAHAVVLEPESLRQRLRDEAEKMFKHY